LEEHLNIEIVISDMKMPIMTGVEFIKKAKYKYPNIKFYILSGYDITDEIQEALDSKLILKYFRKPFNFNEFDDAIKTALI
jgi:YesN/AraC family two-component response regulator